MLAQDILAEHGISYSPRSRYTTNCPICSGGYLTVSINNSDVKWYCHRCRDGGGAKLADGKRRANGGADFPWPIPWDNPAAVYDYTDENGGLLFQVCRFNRPAGHTAEPEKTFRQRRGPGERKWNIEGVRIVPYRLGELLADLGHERVIVITEGEKDVDTLRARGIPATCGPMGAGKWWPSFSDVFRGADVVLCGDNDEPGRAHVELVRSELTGIAKRVRVLDLAAIWPGIRQSDDVTDWFARGGGTPEAFWEAVEGIDAADSSGPFRFLSGGDTILYDPNQPETIRNDPKRSDLADSGLGVLDFGTFSGPIPPREWLYGNIFCRKFGSSLFGDGGIGKTAVRYVQYVALALGKELIQGEHVFARSRVLIISLEDDKIEMLRRLTAVVKYYGINQQDLSGWLFACAPRRDAGRLLVSDCYGNTIKDRLADAIESEIILRKIDLVGIDPFVKAHAVNENSNAQMDEVAGILVDLADKHNIAFDVPHHTAKGEPDPGNADKGRGASATKDALRLVYTLNAMSAEEAESLGVVEEERRFLVRMDSGKVNIAPKADKAKWFKLVGVNLENSNELYPNGDTIQVATLWTPDGLFDGISVEIIGLILDEIAAGKEDGRRYSRAPGAVEMAAWKVVARHTTTKTESQSRAIIRAWVASGLLVEKDYYDSVARKQRAGLDVDNSKRP